ncbi:MAG: hypothetical protein IPO06_22690 [Leptospiraceae bacterium]|nr:hypothetical protein [Leptospiraceae bacterium]
MKTIWIILITFLIGISCSNKNESEKKKEKNMQMAFWAMELCRKPFAGIQNMENLSAPLQGEVPCKSESGFSATSVKTSAYWFWENKRHIISDTGIPYHYSYLTQKSTWKWDEMKFKGKLIKIKSSSSADSCYSGGTLTFLDVDKKVLSQVSFPCRTVAITDTTVPDKTFYLQLDSGDWGVSILIVE